jgi:diguanylate cyclase (GGDEF)-like protein/PAS domain S-box-containing protein
MQAHVYERTRPNGTVLEIRGTPLPEQRGFVTIYTDITERKRAEQEAKRYATYLDTVLNTLPQGVTVVSEDLEIVLWNQRFVSLLGLPPELMRPGLRFEEVIRYNAEQGEYGSVNPDEKVRQVVDLALRFEPHRMERTRPQGQTIEIEGRAMQVEGKVAGFVSTYTDITERIRNEKLIREVKNLMSDAINFSPTFIWETDLEGNFTFLQGIEKILGFSSSELLGRNRYACFVHDAESVRTLRAKMAARQAFDQNVIVANKRSGEQVWLSSSAQAVFGPQGEFVGYRGVDVDITELTRARQELEQMALHDALTGLANRRKFQLHYDLEVLRQQRSGSPLVLLIIDIDHFKAVNDTYGHIVGDTCLKAIANTLVGNARAVDLVARFGGEEFLVLLADTEIDEGLRIAEKLRGAVENLRVRAEGISAPLRITISTGIAGKAATSEMPLDRLIERADAGVYRAKDGGRNRVCLGN